MSIKKIAILLTMAIMINFAFGESLMASAQEVSADCVSEVSEDAVSIITEKIAITNATGPAVVEEKLTKESSVKNTTKKVVKKCTYTKSELRLMSSIILCEAGGESFQGQLAVGIVVMNRVKSAAFPNSVRGVIYQKHQFSPVRQGKMKRTLAQYDAGKTKTTQWKSCIRAAKKVLEGQRTIKYKGKVKNMNSYHFFSMRLKGARFRLGGHQFK